MPKVSVVIPTFNRAKYLSEAIDSVLGQTYRDFEIIVVDDGSTDNSKEIIEKYVKKYPSKIRACFQKNKGVSAARNKGMEKAQGKYIAFLDSDDIWLPEKLKVYLTHFQTNSEIAFIEGRMSVIDENSNQKYGKSKPQVSAGDDLKSLIEKGSCQASSFMVKKDIVKNILFDGDINGFEDLGFCIKIANKNKILNIDNALALYRDHSQNSSSNKIAIYRCQVIFWKKVITEYKGKIDAMFCFKKLAKCYYLLGKEYFIQKDFNNSLVCVFNSIRYDFLVGKNFWKSNELLVSKVFKLIKPYGLLLVSLCLSLLPRENNIGVENGGNVSLRIAVEGYPFKSSLHSGPDVLMRRLTNSIVSQKLAKARSTKFPFYDIALFKIKSKSKYNKPFVLHVDGIYFDTENTVGNSEELNKQIFSSIDKSAGVIFNSDFSRKMVERFHGKIVRPYTIIHNAVNTSLFTPSGPNFRKKLGFSNNDRVIVTSAHWRRHKRLKESVILFQKLRNFSKYSYKLLVLGGKPDYVIKDKDIFYVGEVEPKKLPNWYRTGDLYLHLEWVESCGITQIEALACGLPVICTNNGGIGETIRKAKGGIVSNADEEYIFERVNFYSPPEPDYAILVSDIEKVFENYNQYVKEIDYCAIDINNVAQQCVNFIKRILLM